MNVPVFLPVGEISAFWIEPGSFWIRSIACDRVAFSGAFDFGSSVWLAR